MNFIMFSFLARFFHERTKNISKSHRGNFLAGIPEKTSLLLDDGIDLFFSRALPVLVPLKAFFISPYKRQTSKSTFHSSTHRFSSAHLCRYSSFICSSEWFNFILRFSEFFSHFHLSLTSGFALTIFFVLHIFFDSKIYKNSKKKKLVSFFCINNLQL